MKNMMFRLPEDQHRRLKSILAAQGMTLRQWGERVAADYLAGSLISPSLDAVVPSSPENGSTHG